MEENETKKNEIGNNNISNNTNDNIIKQEENIQLSNNDLPEILNKIFKKSKNNNSQFIPILLKSGKDEITSIFTEKPNMKDENSLQVFIIQKLKLISQIITISAPSPEILHIISNYLSQKNLSIFTYIIELYISFLLIHQNNQLKETIFNEIKIIFSNLISLGLLTRKDVDYIYQKIAFFQLEKKLSIKIFNDIIPILEIIYNPKNINNNIQKNIIAKKYLYFYDKDNSSIETNISENYFINIKKGFTVVLWFYLKEINEDNYKSTLLYIKNEKGEKINIILNEKNDIDILYNDNIYLKEIQNIVYNIKTNIWTQLKICLVKDYIHLFLYQNNDKKNTKTQKVEYIRKCYQTDNSLLKNFSLHNSKITEISFFKNYLGIVGTIIFFKDLDISILKNISDNIDGLLDINEKKINIKLSDKNILEYLLFIFSANLYINNQQIIDPNANIIGKLPNSDEDNYNLNSIFSFHNYTKNIFFLGGFNNFLPLFEILYKFTLNENNTDEINIELKNIFNKLFKIIETVLINGDRNCFISLKKDINFFRVLSLFMEKIDGKYYQDNNELLDIIIYIGNMYYNLKKLFGNVFFNNIVSNPNIIIKFNLNLQKKYIEGIRPFLFLIPIKRINRLLLLLSNKYTNDEIEKDRYSTVLFDYIKSVFENNKVKNYERETLFLLYSNKNNKNSGGMCLSENLFIHIINLFIIYLDIKINYFDYDDKKINQRRNTVEEFLNSENYFIENLLKYLGEGNVHIKKVIINLIRILTQLYGDVFDQYFLKLSKKKKSERINKEEFYIFIKENIASNYENEGIPEDNNSEKNLGNITTLIKNDGDSKNNSDGNKIVSKINKILKEDKNEKTVKRCKSFDNDKKNNSSEFQNKLLDRAKSSRKNSLQNNEFFEKNKLKEIIENYIPVESEVKQNKKNINNNDNNNIKPKKETSLEKRIEIHDTKSEIALILYNWLLSLIKNHEENNDEIKEESIFHVIEYIVKFISYTKELDVIDKILILLKSQKNLNSKQNTRKYDEKVYKLLLYYLSRNRLFIQLLCELLINSYIYKNLYSNNPEEEEDDFVILSIEKKNIKKIKLKIFSQIYVRSLEILLDIYFLEDNKNKCNILTITFIVSLKLLLDFQDANDLKKKSLLLKFLKQLFYDISVAFDQKHKTISNNYLIFFTYFMDYCFILKNADELLQNLYKNIKNDRTHCLPDFLTYGLIYETESVYRWAGSDIYMNIFHNIKKLFSINNIFYNMDFIYKGVNRQKEKEKNIIEYDINLITSLLNEIIYKKKKDSYNDSKVFYGIFYSYKDCGYDNNFPIINIISLFNSLNLYLLYSDNNSDINKEKLISLLNDIQNYIIFLIVIAFVLNPKDDLSLLSYDEIQFLLYQNLFFNIHNICNRLNDIENKKYYLQVLHNIILFLSVFFTIEKNEIHKKGKILKSLFSSSAIDVTKTGPSMLINFYLKNIGVIFNEKNFLFFMKDDKERGMKFIDENLSINDIKNMNNMKDNPSFDMYNINIFREVALKREDEINTNFDLLIKKIEEINNNNSNYKNINLKLKNIKNNNYFDEVEHQQQEIFKMHLYRKIKKDLYSYNNSYSNLQIFYNIPSEQNTYFLKYKVSDFLSKDMSRKIIKPIIDVDYYMPYFRKFDPSENDLYQHPKEQIYSIDLQIFKPNKEPFLYPDIKNNEFYFKNYYLEDDVCYIKTMNHFKGVLFHSQPKKNNSYKYFYFVITEQPETEIKINLYDDYDSLNDSCYNSIFRNNINKKDKDTYLKFNIDDINFIFNRKYSFRDNSLEIFTTYHRSYYFKFKSTERRNNFLEHLLSILNKDSSLFKKLFKPIYNINEFGKKIMLGYYKDIADNYEYSNIINIKEMWKNSKISCFEYLMWVNIYGNRSFRDISQYPVFPWIISNYKTETFNEIIEKKCFRNLKIPMGLSCFNEKAKERQEGYITTYRLMSLDLKDDELIDFKISDEDLEDDEIYTPNENITPSNNNNNNINNNANTKTNVGIIDKITDISLPKIPKYNYNIEKVYKNLSIEYEKIPYLFGSHYSNAMYISHYMGRIFPYALTMIEIQGPGFDCAERLFICIDKTFFSATNEKCDVRELIPEFYFMPELFMNINKLNFGEIEINNYLGAITYYDELVEKNNKERKITVEDVLFPKWCKDNPFLFVTKCRELFENNTLIDINSWIDIIFGYYQRGQPAQQIGNLFLPSSYDGVMNYRLKNEELISNRFDSEYKMRLFELGVNPTKVFDKKLYERKKFLKQITDMKGNIDKNFKFINTENHLYYISNTNNNLLLIGNDYKIKKIFMEERVEANKSYKIKETSSYNYLSEICVCDQYYQLRIKYLLKSNIILFSGFYSGNIYFLSLEKNNFIKSKNTYTTIISKMDENDKLILKNLGKGFITAFEVSQDEKYIIYGNNKGTLVILDLSNFNNNFYSSSSENLEIKLLNITSSHSGYPINSISINTDLNLFSDCSYDNYIHIYTLPRCHKIISIYNKDRLFKLDFIFLCAQPLPSVILYSNKSTKFKCYNINGYNLNVEQNDTNLLNISKYDRSKLNENMISPIIFTNLQFNDYLIYIFRYQFILLRKTPLMDLIFKINFDEKEFITMINLSLMKDCIYAVNNEGKKIYVIHCDKSKNNSKEDNKNDKI